MMGKAEEISPGWELDQGIGLGSLRPHLTLLWKGASATASLALLSLAWTSAHLPSFVFLAS